jgi:hypothetical protein
LRCGCSDHGVRSVGLGGSYDRCSAGRTDSGTRRGCGAGLRRWLSRRASLACNANRHGPRRPSADRFGVRRLRPSDTAANKSPSASVESSRKHFSLARDRLRRRGRLADIPCPAGRAGGLPAPSLLQPLRDRTSRKPHQLSASHPHRDGTHVARRQAGLLLPSTEDFRGAGLMPSGS